MANFKRRRPKNRRAGCLLCKPHKANGAKGSFNNRTVQEQKAILAERDDRSRPSSKKRRYSIENRNLSPAGTPRAGGKWFVYKWYHTKRARDGALTVLQRNSPRYAEQIGAGPMFEFRVGPDRT